MRRATMVSYAVIGCGCRIRGLAQRLNKFKDIQLVGVWDPIEENARQLAKYCKEPQATVYSSYEELLKSTEASWILIGSPNAFHAEQIIASFQAGKHVFSEKPLAVTMEDCKQITDAHKGTNLLFATGFTLRYATIYRKVKNILSSGILGDIISISADENIAPHHGTYIMTNWRRKLELSGPHILEKCVHDLDLINWFCESLPTHITATGGNRMFTKENSSLKEKYPKHFTAGSWGKDLVPFETSEDNPFTSEKSIEDHVSALMTYKNGIKVSFQATTSNAIPERRMYFSCTEGTLIVELYSGKLVYKTLGARWAKRKRLIGGGHGDGDTHIIKELRDSMIHGTAPVCGGKEGLLSAAVASGIEMARESGEVISMEDLWNQLGVTLL